MWTSWFLFSNTWLFDDDPPFLRNRFLTECLIEVKRTFTLFLDFLCNLDAALMVCLLWFSVGIFFSSSLNIPLPRQ